MQRHYPIPSGMCAYHPTKLEFELFWVQFRTRPAKYLRSIGVRGTLVTTYAHDQIPFLGKGQELRIGHQTR